MLLRAGRRQRPVKARWCCSPARPGLGNHGSLPLSGTSRWRAAHALALFLLAATHGQRALSDHRPNRTCCRTGARRHPASEARQARCAAPQTSTSGRTPRCSPRCCHCRTMDAIPRSSSPRSSAEKNVGRAHLAIALPARSRPVLMIFEDAHWADPTSLELFRRAGPDRSLSVLLIVTSASIRGEAESDSRT